MYLECGRKCHRWTDNQVHGGQLLNRYLIIGKRFEAPVPAKTHSSTHINTSAFDNLAVSTSANLLASSYPHHTPSMYFHENQTIDKGKLKHFLVWSLESSNVGIEFTRQKLLLKLLETAQIFRIMQYLLRASVSDSRANLT